MTLSRPVMTAAVAVLVLVPCVASSADFYKGKTISITVGFGPGGGYDRNARLLARHINRHIAGKPTVVVKNQPGAGSLKSVQYLRTAAPKDGTAIVTFNFGQITRSRVLPPKKLKIDFRDFNWIGSISRDLSVCYVWHKIGADSLDALARKGTVNFGLTSKGSASYFNQSMIAGVFGVKLHQVAGYKGSKQKQLAIERGELDGDCGAWSSIPLDWLRDNKVRVVVRFSSHREPDMPASIPFAVDVAKSEDDKKIIRLLTGASDMGRPYIFAKEVAKARVDELRAAFDATMKDAAFLAEAKKQRLPVSPMTGAEAEKALEEVYAMPASIVNKAKAVLIK